MPFDILNMNEAAKRARVSRRMLDYQIKAGAGPAVTRIGRTVRIRDDALEAWLDRCIVPPRSPPAAA